MRKIRYYVAAFAALFIILLPSCNKADDRQTSDGAAEHESSVHVSVPETELAAVKPPYSTSAAQTDETTAVEETAETISAENSPVQADGSVFDRSLFIGDSRTLGLSQYADLGEADVFAASGLNVFRLRTDALFVNGWGNVSLDSLLASANYDKIYIMLGINEIGYDHSFVVRKYGEIVDFLSSACPDAKIILCANLHIVNNRSQNDPIYNNAGINELNDGFRKFCDNDRIVYLDVNPLFDDENGALNECYAVDDFHLVGKYYEIWGQWLAEQSIKQ